MSSRRPPLHTCGVSFLMIAHRVCEVIQDLSEPLGSMNKRVVKVASFTSPFIYALQYQSLILLSFVDDYILAAENMIEKYIPPSEHVFNRIDHLIQLTETLPRKLDYVVNRFPTIIHQVPSLDWALVHVILLLKLLITTLTYWGSQGTREKEIMVDINYDNEAEDNPPNSPVHVDDSENINGDFPPISETQQAADTEAASVNVKRDGMKSTYKEVLAKGTLEDKANREHEKKDKNNVINNIVSQEETNMEGREKTTADKTEESPKNDPILEMFESGWLMKRG